MNFESAAEIHLLHIGKTGGTSLKQMVASNAIDTATNGWKVTTHFHGTRIIDVLAANPRNLTTFFLRDPVSRFVSGFNSRLRQGAPAAHIPWKPAERTTFSLFPTANDLAEALSSTSRLTQDRAFVAMDSMIHSRMHYTYWLREPSYLDGRLDNIAFVGLQEFFAEDAHRMFGVLTDGFNVPLEHRHKAAEVAKDDVSLAAAHNVRKWYAADCDLYEWALRRREEWTKERFVQLTH